ncbi:hypothetical protein [Aestuariivivens insulae]|uniref:hypothetical protein n=1 Tax=Aestuariivivens insulae TaxID=1621988 RepID=UPI001F56541D|nr:hypothetical protein [Aestuariivivens insulae]
MSGITLINIGVNVRVIHVLLPLIFFGLLIVRFRWLIKAFNKIKRLKLFKVYLVLLLILLYTTLIISPETVSGFKLWMTLFINSILGLVFYGVLLEQKINISFFNNLSYLSVSIISLIVVFQFVLSVLGFYEPHMFGKNGFFMLGRPAAFFGDPGWLAYWLIIFSLIVFENRRIGIISTFNFSLFLICILFGLVISQSRVGIFFIGLNFYLLVLHKKISKKVLLILIGVLAGALLIVGIYFGLLKIPENLYYDIVKLRANPRFYDAVTIYSEFVNSGNIWFGNGLGSLDRLVEIYPWRNYTDSHNVIFIQMLNDAGIIGVFVLVYFIYKLKKRLKTRIGKIMYVEFIILLCFHNIFPYFQLFWFLLPLIFVLDRKYEEEFKFY